MSSTLLVKNALILATMDSARREISNGGIFVRDGFIEQVDETAKLPETADEILDLTGHVVLPGLINTHHHFYQTLTRAVPAAQDSNLFNWLKNLYPIWARMNPEDIYTSAVTALAELALSGCTTASDHLYLFPNGSKLGDEIAAAYDVGLRIHASRGSMSLGESEGGLPPDSVVDPEDKILEDSVRVIERYHDANAGSMVQIVLAPCSPFSVTTDLMRRSADLARQYRVQLHTHLAETEDETAFCQQRFGLTPVDYMDKVGWLDKDVWFAHAVHINESQVKRFSHHECGVAHCPSSNMRLGSGIAPLLKYMKHGVKVGLGVDGSASNDGSHLLAEARQAMLLARLSAGLSGASLSGTDAPKLISARECLELGTIGGAKVLGRKDIGSLEVGKCADFFAYDVRRLETSGALHDPVAALVFCQPRNVDFTVVHGKVVVREGQLTTIDLEKHIQKHNQAAARIAQ